MTTAAAITRFRTEGRRFELAFIDADHTHDGARDDLRGVLPMAEVILMHDTTNPPCRAGYVEALRGAGCWHDLDLVEGHIQVDGMWGGIGIVVPSVPITAKTCITARTPTFDVLHALSLEQTAPPALAPPPQRRWLRNLAGILKRQPVS
jgi:hypothetical protein